MLDFKVKVETRTVDTGARRILRGIEKMGNGVTITSGLHEPESSQLPRYRGQIDGQIPIGVYAEWQEYGLVRDKFGDIPPRPFLRSTVASKKALFLNQTVTGIRKFHAGTITIPGLLTLQGVRIKKWIQQTIVSLSQPPNAPLTLAIKRMKKRGSSPLIFSRSMHNAITSHTNYPANGRYTYLTREHVTLKKSLEDLNP